MYLGMFCWMLKLKILLVKLKKSTKIKKKNFVRSKTKKPINFRERERKVAYLLKIVCFIPDAKADLRVYLNLVKDKTAPVLEDANPDEPVSHAVVPPLRASQPPLHCRLVDGATTRVRLRKTEALGLWKKKKKENFMILC